MKVNYRRGLFRLWIFASGVWLAAMAITHGEAIGFYAGFHYDLFARAPSWQAALEEKQRMATFSQLCKRAHDSSCQRPDEAAYAQCLRSLPAERSRADRDQGLFRSRNEYDCLMPVCDRDAYLRNAKALFAASGFPTDRLTAQACDEFQFIDVPYLNWMTIGVTVLPILVPLILWVVGTWIARGFIVARRQ